MILKAEQLNRHLQQALKPMYWASGDETLLVQECCDQIRQAAREQSFSERETWFVDGNFDWQTFRQSGSSLSLFAERKIIELRFRSAKFDDGAKAALTEYLADPNPDTLLLISSPRLESSTPKTKWFQRIESAGVLVQIWPVDTARLPAWLTQRLKQKGLTADPDAIRLLCDRVEGNLLAANQEVEKLAVLKQVAGGEGHIDVQSVASSVADSARYTIFQVIDHALAGNTAKALRSLQGLRNEGEEPLMMVAMLARELRSLLRMAQGMEQGQRPASVMQRERVWQTRQRAVGTALARLDRQHIEAMIMQLRETDLAVKGMSVTPPWLLLEQLLLQLAGNNGRG